MSIIQEALKKVQKHPEKKDEEWQVPKRDADEGTFTDITYSPAGRGSPAKVYFQESKKFLRFLLPALLFAVAAFYFLKHPFPSSRHIQTIKKEDAVVMNKDGYDAVKPVVEEKDDERLVRSLYIPPNIATAMPQNPAFVLNGIMFLESGSRAIINGSVVEKGDVISGATVEAIEREKVLLKYKDEKIMLRLK